MERLEIRTRDGECPAYLYRPASPGVPVHAVLVYMDGLGIRPAMLEVGERLAAAGYLALVPDLYYRSGPYPPMNPHVVFADPQARRALTERFSVHATQANIMADTAALLACLQAQPQVDSHQLAAVGYCMGGCLALAAAGHYPQQLAAVASYHGGRLATDAPDSPHLLAGRMRAEVYVAGAIEDASFPDDMKARLGEALRAAQVKHLIETYPARHGWVFRDIPTFDARACERHWQSLLALLARTWETSQPQ